MSEYNRVMGWAREKLDTSDSIRGLRIFLWEFIDHEDTKASCLSHILSTLAMSSRSNTKVESVVAEGLYHLLGPAPDSYEPSLTIFQQNTVNRLMGTPNKLMMQELVPTTYEEGKKMFCDLGRALRLLLRSHTLPNYSLVSIMVAMFGDMQWDIDNQAACLLFSCDTVVKMFISDLIKRKVGVMKTAHLLVAMVLVCGRFNNDLRGGVFQIVQWSFTLLKRSERKKLINEFWREIGERMEDGYFTEDLLIQLGVLVGGKGYSASCEEDGRRKSFRSVGDVEE